VRGFFATCFELNHGHPTWDYLVVVCTGNSCCDLCVIYFMFILCVAYFVDFRREIVGWVGVLIPSIFVLFFAAIFSAISATRPRADVAYCIHALARRLSKTHNWAVCAPWLRSYPFLYGIKTFRYIHSMTGE
jgi:hypothetical protein